MIKFLKKIFTPLFNACMIMVVLAGQGEGGYSVVYYALAVVLFVADIIDSQEGK